MESIPYPRAWKEAGSTHRELPSQGMSQHVQVVFPLSSYYDNSQNFFLRFCFRAKSSPLPERVVDLALFLSVSINQCSSAGTGVSVRGSRSVGRTVPATLWMAWSVLLGAVKTSVTSGVESFLANPVHSAQSSYRRSEFREY